MKSILNIPTAITTLALTVLPLTAQEAAVATETVPKTADNVAPKGFTALFNGKDLTNWKGQMLPPFDKPHKRADLTEAELAEKQKAADAKMKQHWSVTDDGLLHFDGKGKSLATFKKYKDFEFHVSWKINAHGDSGIYLRGLPQVQIWDTKSPKCQKYGAAKGSGGMWNNKEGNGKWPLVHADNPVGEWNHFFIRMVGDKVSVWLNGKQTVDSKPLIHLWQKGKPLPESEVIELQCHGDPVWFKNIYVREL